jgi:type VI secretion system secreted protein Hcp
MFAYGGITMASVFFLKLDGIDGQSGEKHHEKWVEIISFCHGSFQNVSIERGGDVAGRGELSPFVFVHAVDRATPKLQQYCLTGKKIAKAAFQYCRIVVGESTPTYEVTLENIRVSKTEVKTIGTSNGDPLAQQPVEEVSLIAGKVTWKVTPIKPDGSRDGAIEASFDQLANG